MQLDKLAAALESLKLPDAPVRLGPGVVVTDPRKFIASHLAVLTAESNQKIKQPRFLENYHERLQTLSNNINEQDNGAKNNTADI